jgi:hypothetical protein
LPEKLKFIEPTYRRPDISVERFHYHWRAIHGPIGAALASVGGYIQLHRVVPGLPGLLPLGCEGISDSWFPSVEAMEGTYDDPVYQERAKPDNDYYADVNRGAKLFAREEVVVAGGDERPDGVKAVVLLKRRDDVAAERFAEDWRAWSAEVVEAAGPVHAARCTTLTDGPRTTVPFDAVELLAWPTLAELEAAWDGVVRPLLPALGAFADLTVSAGWAGEEFHMKRG